MGKIEEHWFRVHRVEDGTVFYPPLLKSTTVKRSLDYVHKDQIEFKV